MFRADSKLMRILETAADFIALNLLFIMTCLPVVTVGASTAAMYTVTRRMARKEHPAVTQAYFAAFKSNFRQSIPLTLLLLCPFLLLAALKVLIVLQILMATPLFNGFFTVAMIVISVIWTYLWPIQAWFENSKMDTLRNAMLMPFGNPLIAAVATLMNMSPYLWLTRDVYSFLQTSFFWLAAAFALTAFLNTQLLRLQFRQYLPDDEFTD